ncbi:MAG: hypothetical protein ACI8PZ_004563 [Myxococcota bacterium]
MRVFVPVLLIACVEAVPIDDAAPWSADVALSPPAGDLTLRVLGADPGGNLEVEVSGLGPYEHVYLLRGTDGDGACPGVLGGVCLELGSPSLLTDGWADSEGVALLTRALPPRPGLEVCVEAAAVRGPGAAFSGTSGAECVVLGGIGGCDDESEVEHEGRCYYLDGSGGACDLGYELAPQSVFDDISRDFIGKNYKHTASSNCCIWHRDQDAELQDWGMNAECNAPGPFTEGPVVGGAGCLDALNLDPGQLTVCMSM